MQLQDHFAELLVANSLLTNARKQLTPFLEIQCLVVLEVITHGCSKRT